MTFLLLPLYTAYMTQGDYGSADLVISTVNLMLPIFTLEITSAVMRFSIEKSEDSSPFLANGLAVIFSGFALLLLFIPVFKGLGLFAGHLSLFYLLYICNALYQLLSYYARAVERIRLVGIVGVINTLTVITGNIIGLTVLGGGLKAYLVSYILGYAIGFAVLFISLIKVIDFGSLKVSGKDLRDMVKYTVPLIPNNISWWGVSSANKYIISGFLSTSVLGLYSVALKVPTIINTIQGIFSEALVLSVFQEYKNAEKDEKYFSFLYRLYSLISVNFTSCIIIATKIISSILFSNDFSSAWVFVPFLCVPSVWGSLSGYLGTFYAASKKNSGMFVSTVIGCVITLAVSIISVQFIGIAGVIASNIFSYFAIWLYRWIDVKRFVTLKVNMGRDLLSWLTLIAQAAVTCFVKPNLLMYGINVLLFIVLMLLHFPMISELLGNLINWIKTKKAQS